MLDIGLNSISNTFKLGWSRRAVWILLGLSSIPLHLMSNSVIYATTTAYKYSAIVVTDDFFQGANWTMSALETYFGGGVAGRVARVDAACPDRST